MTTTAPLSPDAAAMLLHFDTVTRTLIEGRWPPRVMVRERTRAALEELHRAGFLSFERHRNGTATWAVTDEGLSARERARAMNTHPITMAYQTLACEMKILDVKGRIT